MAETIRINVLVISAESENLTKRRIITLETTFDNTIDQLRPMIMEIRGKYSIQFDQYKRKEFYGSQTELEAENVGLGVLRRRNAEVEEILAKLRRENSELEVELCEAKNENEKLRRKLESRIEELEKSRANTDAENTKLKSRVDSSVVDEQPQNEQIKEVVSEAVDVSDSLVDPSSNAAEVKPDERVTSSEQESRHVQSNNSSNNSSSNSNSITEPKVSTKGEIDVEDFLNEKLKLRKQENFSEEIKQRNERKGLIQKCLTRALIAEAHWKQIKKKFYAGITMEEIFLKQLNILRKKRSQDTESPFPDISRDSLRKKTQRAVKIYKLVERRIIDHFTEKPNLDFTDDHDDSTDSKEAIIKTADYDDDPFKILEDEEDPFIAIRDEILEEESN
ncbi:hypothetical protein RhiirA5_409703 [Rhizophagus irregularis]|uniref:Uncharacterized protein n=1 Tax=Rhizophagus irregularis TaxID=588596 RepID=A0A2N0Q537_9GLOM|nr:hypothetical protein RhiirA5_409703 [Rhizophagus irregularis]